MHLYSIWFEVCNFVSRNWNQLIRIKWIAISFVLIHRTAHNNILVCVCVQFCFAALYIRRILLCTICMWLIQFCYSTSIHFSTNSWFCRDQLKTICYLNEGWIISWAFLRLSIAYSSLSHTRFRKEEALWLCIQKIKLLQARNTILNLPLLPRK